jgi:hypothetical protein
MPDYYAYLIGVDGRVSQRVPIVCDDDKEAKRFANQMVDGHALELWQEGRKIATFEPVARSDRGRRRLLIGWRRDGRSNEGI